MFGVTAVGVGGGGGTLSDGVAPTSKPVLRLQMIFRPASECYSHKNKVCGAWMAMARTSPVEAVTAFTSSGPSFLTEFTAGRPARDLTLQRASPRWPLRPPRRTQTSPGPTPIQVGFDLVARGGDHLAHQVRTAHIVSYVLLGER